VDEMIKLFSELGLSLGMIVVLIVQVRYLQSKLLEVIEENTRALEQLRGVIERCQLTHKVGGV